MSWTSNNPALPRQNVSDQKYPRGGWLGAESMEVIKRPVEPLNNASHDTG